MLVFHDMHVIKLYLRCYYVIILKKQVTNSANIILASIKEDLGREKSLASKYLKLSLELTSENKHLHQLVEELRQNNLKETEMYKKELEKASAKTAEGERQQALLRSQVFNTKLYIFIFLIEAFYAINVP
jgi:hypothetical protein